MFPLVADLRGRRVVVVGAGRVGADKATALLECGARVTVISEQVLAPLPDGLDQLLVRPYETGDLAGALLVVAATANPAVNDAIVNEADQRGILVNVVDDLARSTFHFTANYRDGDVLVAVSTAGASPALAQWVRNRVAAALPSNLARVARHLRRERALVHEAGQSTEHLAWARRVSELVGETSGTDEAAPSS
ncbi:MAG: bifunctional precorrin-2 dehydrogenase/sirohydrochlorin ferrochelatase [Acidimicrobiales bacterium]